jgi:hypothetical protein
LSTQTLNKNYKDTTHYKNNPQQTHTPTSHQQPPAQTVRKPPGNTSSVGPGLWGTTCALIMGCSRPLSRFQTPRKHQPNQGHHILFGLIFQGPTVCQTFFPHHPLRFPHPPGEPNRPYSAKKQLKNELSSMIPLVNTTNAHHTATPTNAEAR